MTEKILSFWQKPVWHFAAIVLGFVSLVAGSLGCATILATESSRSTHHTPPKPLFDDEIFALGKVDEATTQKIGRGPLVAFLGNKQTYLLERGGDKLLQIARQLDGRKLRLAGNEETRITVWGTQIGGTVVLYYDAGNTLEDKARGQLTQLGFTPQRKNGQESGHWRVAINVSGFMSAPARVSAEQQQLFTRRYPLTLFSPAETDRRLNPAAVVTVPLAVVVDIVLTPVYLGALLVVGLSGH